MPPDRPVTVPPTTEAVPVALLLHIPPVVPSLSTVVAAGHTESVPVIVPALGVVPTVTCITDEPPV